MLNFLFCSDSCESCAISNPADYKTGLRVRGEYCEVPSTAAAHLINGPSGGGAAPRSLPYTLQRAVDLQVTCTHRQLPFPPPAEES